MKFGLVFFVLILLLVDVLVFAGIYEAQKDEWMIAVDPDRHTMSFGEAVSYSISTATLWGPGDFYPMDATCRGWSSTQASLSFLLLALLSFVELTR